MKTILDKDKKKPADLKVLDEEDNSDLEPAELTLAKKNRARLEHNIEKSGDAWGLSPVAMEAREAARRMLSTKDGLHARVPIVCKGESCPYSRSCQLLPYDMAPVGEYCPVELAQIDLRARGYTQDIDYDEASFTDKALMSELITLDVLLERCKALMARDGTPVIDIAIGVDQEGNEIDQPAVSKAWEAYEKISKKRDQTYQLLMLTRKDNKNKDNDIEGQNVSNILHSVIDSAEI